MKILHIATHLGFGAGKAISGLIDDCKNQEVNIEQKLVLLEKPEKRYFYDKVLLAGNEIFLFDDIDDISQNEKYKKFLAWADIVVLDWWAHPLMMKLLYKWPSGISTRLIMWSHVNGCTFPYLPFSFTEKFEKILFTTNYSYENGLWTDDQKRIIQEKADVIYGTGHFIPSDIEQKTYDEDINFVVGYVGTVNYSKMNPNYLSYCVEVINKIPNTRFLIVGDVDPTIVEAVESMGLSLYFDFVGYQENVFDFYYKMDVLAYLLRTENFATTENVILEAMSCGLPVVAIDNPPEAHIIESEKTGYLVSNDFEGIKSFASKISQLKQSKDLRIQIGTAAKRYIEEKYPSYLTASKFMEIVNRVIEGSKKKRIFKDLIGETPYDWFTYLTGFEQDYYLDSEKNTNDAQARFYKTCPDVYMGKTKSSLLHFARYFPNDKKIQEECKVIKNIKRII